jgi:hypothetical protein
VDAYTNVDDALVQLRASPPDAVIAGASDGAARTYSQMVRDVRDLGPGVLAFLLVPGRGDERALLAGLNAGADDVITVPFSASDLAGRVAAALFRVRARAEVGQRTRVDGEGEEELPLAEFRSAETRHSTSADPISGAVRVRAGAPTRRDGLSSRAGIPSTQTADEDEDLVPDAPTLSAGRVSLLATTGEEEKLRGKAFDRYILVRTLGVGGMGIVLEAEHARTKERVAVKILREDVAKDRDAAMRFLREAYVLQAIEDRNVVKILDIGRQGGRLFYAMELVKGENLAQRLDRETRLQPAEACRIGAGVARALAALARRGIVHRDVKPGNVFLGTNGDVKLGDFGLAKRAFARCVTPVREPLGTPHYLAPEVVSGGNATPLSDLYSLGIVLHETLAGSPPFEGRDTMVLLYRVCHGPPVDTDTTLAHVPRELRETIARSIARDPKARFSDAAAFARTLERLRVRLRA